MHFDWDSFWGLVWYSLVVFAFIAYLIILFNIIVDLFWRDHKTSGRQSDLGGFPGRGAVSHSAGVPDRPRQRHGVTGP